MKDDRNHGRSPDQRQVSLSIPLKLYKAVKRQAEMLRLPASKVRQEGGDGRIYLLRGGDDSSTLAEIAQTVRCLEANRRLAEDRIGLVGASSDWLVASSQRPEIVAARFGMKLLPLGLDELRAHMARDSAPSQKVEQEVRFAPDEAVAARIGEELARVREGRKVSLTRMVG